MNLILTDKNITDITERIIERVEKHFRNKEQDNILYSLRESLKQFVPNMIKKYGSVVESKKLKEESTMNIKMAPLVKEQGSEFDTILADLKKRGINEEEIPQDIIRERLPDALKAWIGRKKYGKKKFQAMAQAGRKK
jgi:hypothetical protein